MNTSFERSSTKSTNEWYTPKWIIDSLGEFDTDPCAPIAPPYKIANTTYNIYQDGLANEWYGRVYLNPPYSHPIIDKFIDRMRRHNNGIALIFDRCDNSMWQDMIFPSASALLFMRGRIKFLTPEFKTMQGAGCGSVLVSWGSECADILENCCIQGKYIRLI